MCALVGYELLGQMRRHQPELLAREIKRAMGAGGVSWREPGQMNTRWQNLDFLRAGGKAASAWPKYWPQLEHPIPWDAIGRVQMGRVGWEWLLVGAYAKIAELQQGVPVNAQIAEALDETRERAHARPSAPWTSADLDLARRLAVLHFLRKHGVCCRLLLVYFYQDDDAGQLGYATLGDWEEAIGAMSQQLGLSAKSVLERRIYRVFLPLPA